MLLLYERKSGCVVKLYVNVIDAHDAIFADESITPSSNSLHTLEVFTVLALEVFTVLLGISRVPSQRVKHISKTDFEKV